MTDLPENKKIVLFDGVCNLCNGAVMFIIKHDKKDIFRFISLQSNKGQEIQKQLNLPEKNIDIIILYVPYDVTYYKADAVLEIAKNLGSLSYFVPIANILPNRFQNFVYDFVAKNRYRWFGKKTSCLLPTKEIKSKFLE